LAGVGGAGFTAGINKIRSSKNFAYFVSEKTFGGIAVLIPFGMNADAIEYPILPQTIG
jgi:hypothetical protein